MLRTIEAMRVSANPEIEEHGRLNFEPMSHLGTYGREQGAYRMTEEGVAQLAMSFTGDKSKLIWIRFIEAFKALAKQVAARDAELAAHEEAGSLSITKQLHALARREPTSELQERSPIGPRAYGAPRRY